MGGQQCSCVPQEVSETVLVEVPVDSNAVEPEEHEADEPEEHKLNVEKYTGIGSLKGLIGCDVKNSPVILIKASYFLDLNKGEEPQPIPARQQLPPHAVVGEEMLGKLFEELAAWNEKGITTKASFSGVVVVSHCWAEQGHPDPEGKELKEVLAPAIEWYMCERARLLKANAQLVGSKRNDVLRPRLCDFGLFFDWASLFQKVHKSGGSPTRKKDEEEPFRTKDEEKLFQQALGQMDVLYAHQHTVKWRLTGGENYNTRGWPFFETTCAQLISWKYNVFDLGQHRLDTNSPARKGKKHHNFKGKKKTFESVEEEAEYLRDQADYEVSKKLQDGGDRVAGVLADQRRPPLVPDAFAREIDSEDMTFTNGTDKKKVKELQKRVALEVLQNVEKLHFNRPSWGLEQSRELAAALSMCSRLKSLKLLNFPISGKTLEEAFQTRAKLNLQELHLVNASLDDEGLEAIAEALAKDNVSHELEDLRLQDNKYTSVQCLVGVLGNPEAAPNLKYLRLMKVDDHKVLKGALDGRQGRHGEPLRVHWDR